MLPPSLVSVAEPEVRLNAPSEPLPRYGAKTALSRPAPLSTFVLAWRPGSPAKRYAPFQLAYVALAGLRPDLGEGSARAIVSAGDRVRGPTGGTSG